MKGRPRRGRPRRFTMPVNRTVTLEATELDALRVMAAQQGESVSALIRRAIQQVLSGSECKGKQRKAGQ